MLAGDASDRRLAVASGGPSEQFGGAGLPPGVRYPQEAPIRQPAASPFTARRSGSEIPRDEALDSSLALLREGYAFIPARCRRLASDLFETRIMLSKAVCMSGAEAAAEFYRPDRFTRRHAMPPSAFTLIQDNGSVMALDGEAHRRRKAMFLSVMRPERLGRFVELVEARFRDRLQTWPRRPRIILFEEANLALCAAVCEWAGLDLTADEIALRSAEFAAMIDGTGSIGPRNWKGHLLRARSERWARGLIRSAREGRIAAPKGSALEAISTYREADGQELDLASAGVELINVLRPTVANARYVAFAAIACTSIQRPGVKSRPMAKPSRASSKRSDASTRSSPSWRDGWSSPSHGAHGRSNVGSGCSSTSTAPTVIPGPGASPSRSARTDSAVGKVTLTPSFPPAAAPTRPLTAAPANG